MVFCIQCGQTVPDDEGVKFCPACGTAIVRSDPQVGPPR
jgi:predicted RNA-binding Zn-ribbon protein involved in translation (DUF1610 family)